MSEEKRPKTLTVAQAGAEYFGLCRASAYAAVARGEIPVIKVGRLLRVPVAAMERLMEQAAPLARPMTPEARRK